MSFLSFFSRRASPDGSSAMLEAVATGVSPALLNGIEAETPSGRRERGADAGSAVIVETLGVKLMHGWLQNRHQTLMPLTLNMSVMRPEQKLGMARILASFVLAGRPAGEALEFAPVLRTWLSGLGGGPDVISAYDEACEAPLPLNVIFTVAQANELSIHAYVAALMASDTRYPVSVMLCDLVQARFDLPSAVIRSAVRRYRR